MRILFVTHFFDPEPGAIRGLPLARWLQQRGHQVEVLTGFPNYPQGKLYPGYRLRWRQREIMDGVPVLRVPLYPSHDASALRRALNYSSFAISAGTLGAALSGRADVAYVYHPPATVGLPALVLKALRGLPFVYHIADMWPESVIESGMLGNGRVNELAERALSRWCHFVYQQAAAITVLSPGFKRLLVARGVPAEKVDVIYNWTDEEVFHPLPRDAALEGQLGLEGCFNVVYAGNLGAFQGLETVIRAALLLKGIPAIRFVLAGTGQKEGELRALARKLGADNVVFIGHRPYWQMPAVNSLADVLLIHLKDLPIFRSTIPSKTQVALACGKPVLMGLRGDAAEIIERAHAGMICEPESDAGMAQAAKEMYGLSRELRDAMGERGREFYRREMSLEVGGRRMEEILQQVVAPAGPSMAAT